MLSGVGGGTSMMAVGSTASGTMSSVRGVCVCVCTHLKYHFPPSFQFPQPSHHRLLLLVKRESVPAGGECSLKLPLYLHLTTQ